MNKQCIKIYALFTCILLLAGCARSVQIISPADQSQHTPPVNFEVEVRGYNFYATLDGLPITQYFTMAGQTATAISSAPGFPALDPGTTHRFYTYADLQPQPWQANDYNDEVTFTMAPLPALSFAPSGLTVDIGSQQAASVNIPNGAPANLTMTLAPQNSRISINSQPAGNSVSIQVPQNAVSQAFTVAAVQAGASAVSASATGFQSASMSVSVPSPTVSMMVTPVTDTVVWGQTASYTIELGSQHAFSGPVTLVVDQLPAGVTPALSSGAVTLAAAGPAQTVSLSLATAFGASPLGTASFRVRATSTAPTVNQNASLSIRRSDGAFVKRSNLSAPSTSCGANVTATYQSYGINDIRARFHVDRPTGAVTTQTIPAVFYTLSQPPDCRIGVVMHPCQGVSCSGAGDPAISWYNLQWETATGAPNIPQRVKNLTRINWHQFWFSADSSLLLLVTKMQQAVTCPPSCPYLDMRAFVYDSLTGNRLGQVDFRTRATGSPGDPGADVTGASLSGNTVTINFVRETGNADSRSVTIP